MATYNPLPNLGTKRNAPTDIAGLIGAPRGTMMPAIPGFGGPGAPVPAPGAGVPGVGPTVGANGALPTELLGQTAGNLSGALRGELPQDVINLIEQQAAERGIGGGTAGSQAANYGGLRTLGLTSLDRMKGAEELLGKQFMTPAQQAELDNARLDREGRERLAREELTGRQKHDESLLALEREKLAELRAQEANKLAFAKQQYELQALGGKYGVSPAGGAPTRYGSGNLSPFANNALEAGSKGVGTKYKYGF